MKRSHWEPPVILPIVLYATALVCYSTSFFLPTFGIVVKGQVVVHDGVDAFTSSLFIAPFQGGLKAVVVWLANPAFWAAAVFFAVRRNQRALAASLAAVLLSGWHGFGPLLFVGYYVWLVSLAMLAVACAINMARPRLPAAA